MLFIVCSLFLNLVGNLLRQSLQFKSLESLVSGLDLLELVWGHILLQQFKVVVEVFPILNLGFFLGLKSLDDRLKIKFRGGVELYEPIVLPVKHGQEYLLAAHVAQLDALLEDASFTFEICHSLLLGFFVLFVFSHIIFVVIR